jgi:hypothetical protein
LAKRKEFGNPKSQRPSRRNLDRFLRIFPVFMEAAKDKKVFTNKELKKFEYYDYLKTRLHPKERDPLTRWGRRHVLSIMPAGDVQDIKRKTTDV